MLSLKLGGVRGRAPRSSPGATRRVPLLRWFRPNHPSSLLLTISRPLTWRSSSRFWIDGTRKRNPALKNTRQACSRPPAQKRGRWLEKTPTIPSARWVILRSYPRLRIQYRPGRSEMHLPFHLPQHGQRPGNGRLCHSCPANASEGCYSFSKCNSGRHCAPVSCALTEPNGGRGPPGRRCRPKLQAMSNSLQLTSD